MLNIFKTITVILLLNVINSSSTFAVPKDIFYNKEYRLQLLSDVQYLLSVEETMDYDAPRLWEILNKHNYRLFRTYKAFIEFERSKRTYDDMIKAKKFLTELYILNGHRKNILEDMKLYEEHIMYNFLSLITDNGIVEDIADILPGERQKNYNDNGYKYLKIPLWLVLKYPVIANYTHGVYLLTINAKRTVGNIDDFIEFMSFFAKMSPGIAGGQTGLQQSNSYLMTHHFYDVISFNPKSYIERDIKNTPCGLRSIKDRLLALELEAVKSEENKIKYKKFLFFYNKAVQALQHYYRNNYNLDIYANEAENILSHYVCENMSDPYTSGCGGGSIF